MKKIIEYTALVVAIGLSIHFLAAVLRSVDKTNQTGIGGIGEDHIPKSQTVQVEAPPILGPEEARRWKQRLESLGMWPEPTIRMLKPENPEDGWCCSREDPDDAKRHAEWYKELKKRAAAELLKKQTTGAG